MAESSRTPLLWLAAGALLGVGLAAQGLLATGSGLPDGVVASVNGTPIYREEFERLVAGLESDTRAPATPESRRRVLDRMIEEELLVQRGLELGLADSDRRVRADITAAMIRSVVVEAEDRPPTEAELRDFFDREQGFFTSAGRLHVRQVFFRVRSADAEPAARERAEQARARLVAGEPFEAVREALGDAEISPLPDTPLPPAKLREYLGPTALRAVLELPADAWSEPVRSGTGLHLLWLVEREEPRTPPFEEAADAVRAEWVRRAGDRALRGYLDQLRERADVVLAGEAS